MQTLMCSPLPAKDQHNVGHPFVTFGIMRAKFEVFFDPCSNFPPKVSPPNAFAIVGWEILRTALEDQYIVASNVDPTPQQRYTQATCR